MSKAVLVVAEGRAAVSFCREEFISSLAAVKQHRTALAQLGCPRLVPSNVSPAERSAVSKGVGVTRPTSSSALSNGTVSTSFARASGKAAPSCPNSLFCSFGYLDLY